MFSAKIVIVGKGAKLISLVFVSVGGVSELSQGGTDGDDVLEGFVEGEGIAMGSDAGGRRRVVG